MAGNKAKISSKSKSHPNKGKGFGNFIYDSDEGTVFGRTAGSWIKIIIFYIIFYACLAGFFSLNFYIFSKTLNENSPKWTLSESLIGANPGIGFRPMPDQDATAESTLIWYQSESEKDSHMWYGQLKEFIEKTEQPIGAPGVIECNYYNGMKASEKNSCRVDLSNLGPCVIGSKFGYRDANPCVLIKLNKIYGWEPEPFGVKDNKFDMELLKSDLAEKIEDGMPTDLKDYILKEVVKPEFQGNEVNLLKTVWMSCSGENVGDKENLPAGHITYYPKRGIPGYYFPYANQPSYKSPFIFVHLELAASARHVLINIECRAWAKNVKYERQFRLGSVHFEVMVD